MIRAGVRRQDRALRKTRVVQIRDGDNRSVESLQRLEMPATHPAHAYDSGFRAHCRCASSPASHAASCMDASASAKSAAGDGGGSPERTISTNALIWR